VLVGRTTGNLPYLEYGLGTDRLGGAKMGYLDTGIVVRVVDSTIVNYKLRLSSQHYAYLPKDNFQKDSSIKLADYYLGSSWLIHGNDSFDFVSVALDERLPYRSYQEINPSRIVIDIMGATSNTNWITQRSTAKEVRRAYLQQIEDDVYRVIIELNHDQHWGYSIYYEGKRLIVKIKRQPARLHLEGLTVAVDAGHGGDNTGALGVSTQIREKAE
jgi:N-acetylmuramoyl-L-alanine amidase